MKPSQEPTEYIYNSTLKLALRSLELDWQWIRIDGLEGKWMFLWKKYLFILCAPLFWDKTLHSYRIHVWNRTIYMDSRNNIGIIQSTFIYNSYLRHFLPKNPLVVDIGAHTGEFALFSDILLKARRVLSFEPVTASYKLLSRNKQTDVYHTAIGLTSKKTMYIPTETAMASGIHQQGTVIQEETPCIPLDAVLEIKNLPTIDLLKVDVEGMEYEVLQASSESIKKSRYILTELSIERSATNGALETLEYVLSIAPSLKLIHIGQIFGNYTWTDSVDILLKT